MTQITALLSTLRERKVTLWAEGDQLRYRAPRGQLTPDLLAEMKRHKAAILDVIRQASRTPEAAPPPITRVARDQPLPLSFAQQRLWLLDQLEGSSVAYNLPAALRLRGRLVVEALRESLQALTHRHESLRTRFPDHQGQPRQHIDPPGPFDLPLTDLTPLETDERHDTLERLSREEAVRVFDLATGPLFRARLLRLAPEEHVLLLTMHHIISDGWSMGVIFDELVAGYQGRLQGEPFALPALPVQYADYARWQRDWLTGPVLARQVAYWRQRLAGLAALHTLPTDRPRPAVQSYQGGAVVTHLDRALAGRLAEVARQTGTTLFMVLQTALVVLLSRYSGSEDIVVGTPVANRRRGELEVLVGFFVNTLVLRTDVSGDPTLAELLGRVREGALGAYAHQDVPFERLVEELRPVRSLSHAPLFQVMLAYQNTPRGRSWSSGGESFSGLEVEVLDGSVETSKFDLTVSVSEASSLESSSGLSEEGMSCWWEYNADIFDASTVLRLGVHYARVLGALAKDPAVRVSSVSLLTAAERRRMEAWNQTARSYEGAGASLALLFEAQVARSASSVALVSGEERLSYGDLNARSNRLAHYLRGLGVGPEVLVGLCMERGVSMVVGLLGVLKAGGAYVPLDPSYPRERLSFMVSAAGMSLVLTDSSLVSVLEAGMAGTGARLIALDAEWDKVASEEDANPVNNAGPDNAAYMIYTSGSTGKPKGAVNTHRGICNRLFWMQEVYELDATDRVLQKTTFSFDVSVWEFFWPLITGARLVLAAPEGHKDNAYLVKLMQEEHITTVHFVPSMLQHWVEEPGVKDCTHLRRVICSGEALPRDLADRFFQRSAAELHNLYGPTEAAIDVTYWPCSPDEEATTIPIGRPISNIQIYLLDGHGHPVPVGVPGELYIAGVGLARGYHGRPGLTAACFLPNPFNSQPGERLYRTGDRARYLPDGQIAFLGRIDHQVKLRGFRIELGEIEAVLARHRDVRACVVVTQQGPHSHPHDPPRLVAYLVAEDPGDPPAAPVLRRHLQDHLPDYMIPAVFAALEALPLTPSGKIDRRALPAPAWSREALETGYLAPRTDTEALLVRLWMPLLGLDRVGVHDNFFELGGDSILSIQLVARARQAGLSITPRDVFEHQTIATLALAAGSSLEVEAEQGPVTGSAPLTPIQAWFLDRPGPWHHFNQAVLLETPAGLSWEALARTLLGLVAHHDALRLRYEALEDASPGEGGASAWSQEHAPVDAYSGDDLLSVVDLSEASEAERAALVEAGAASMQAAFSLSEGPLFRGLWFDYGPGARGRLALVAHHLVIDGVSWRILLDDLAVGYGQAVRGEAVALPPKTTSYRRWSEHLAGYVRSEALAGQVSYWQAVVDQPCRLPLDDAAGARDGEAGDADAADAGAVESAGEVTLRLSRDETQALLRVVPAAYHSRIDEVLLAALAVSFGRWQQRRGEAATGLLVDLEGHGRQDLLAGVDLSRTVGWFTALFPVYLRPSAQGDLGTTLKAIKEQLRSVPQGGLGYGVLRYLAGAASLASPAPVSFNYLGQVDGQFAQAGSETDGSDIGGSDAAERSGWSLAEESVGAMQSAERRRSHPVEVGALVVGGRLQLTWGYSRAVHQRAHIETWVDLYRQALQEVIDHCLRPDAGGYTPSDFALVALSQGQLDRIERAYPSLEDLYPLTPLQQGLLFETLYQGESGIYAVQVQVRLSGTLEAAVFRRAWQQVVARHAVLRTAVAPASLTGGVSALQVVLGEVSLPWQEHDWRDRSEADQERALTRLLELDRAAGFAVHEAPLMRMTLVRLSARSYVFVWSHHHLLLDGWSLPIVVREVLACYRAGLGEEAAPLPPVRRYREYVGWLLGQDASSALSYWRGELSGLREPTRLKLAGRRNKRDGTSSSDTMGRYAVSLSAEATGRLEAQARSERVTLSTVLQGVWSVLLSRYAGRREVVFGMTISGRSGSLAGVESMVGLFINTVPVRVEVVEASSVWSWLRDLQTRHAERERYGHSSLASLQRLSGVAGGASLFETLLVVENYPVSLGASSGEAALGFELEEVVSREQTHYPLTVVVVPGAALRVTLEYQEEGYAGWQVARMGDQVVTLLEALIDDAGASSQEMSLQVLFESLEQMESKERELDKQRMASISRASFKKTRRKPIRE